MADLDPSWTTVLLSDSSAVSFVGNWSAHAPSGFHNVSYPETDASVAFSFHGTVARVVGFVTFGPHDEPLRGRITSDSEEIPFGILSSGGDTRCIGDGPSSLYNPGGTETCPPPTFYPLEEALPCNQYTLNLTVSPDQAMQLKQFEFLPCTSDGKPASASTTALASASSSANAVAAEKKQTLSTGVIAGATLGALTALLALGSLAFLIIFRRRRRRRRYRRRIGTLPSPSSPPPSPSPSPFLMCFSRPRSWLRLPGRHPRPTNPSAEFLTSSSSSSSSRAAASRGDSKSVQGYYPTTTMVIDASGSTPPSTTLPMMGSAARPWSSSARSAGNARDGGTAFEKQQGPEPSGLPVVARGYLPDSKELLAWQEREQAGAQGLGATFEKQQEPEPSGLPVARGYLPDSLMAWQEREQAGAQGPARTPSTTEVLPLYQTRRSLRRPS